MSIRVLYIHHSGTQGGSSRSMLEMIQAFPEHVIKPLVITPAGSAAQYFKKNGIPIIICLGISKFDISQLGYYHDKRWLIILRELFYFPFTLWSFLIARFKYGIPDLVHINDVQSVPILLFLRFIFNVPIIQHIRCPLMIKQGRRKNYIEKLIQKRTKAVIAIDQTVFDSISSIITNKKIIHNGLKLPPRLEIKRSKSNDLIVGMVSNMFEFKGVIDFVEAANICKKKGLDIEFKIIGGKSKSKKGPLASFLDLLGFRHNVEQDVIDLIDKYGLKENFKVEEFVQDLSVAYSSIDVLCFPSHINAVGRPVFEAGFFGKPSIVAIEEPKSDAIVDHKTGICVNAKSPLEISKAIEFYYENPDQLKSMGIAAQKLAHKYYDVLKNANEVLQVYKSCTS